MASNRKVTAKYILSGVIMLLLVTITLQIEARDKHFKGFFKSLTQNSDTTRPSAQKNDTSATDTIHKKITDTTHNDSVKKISVDTLNFSKDSLDAPVDYKAEDSAVLFIPQKQFYLYGKANTVFKGNDLTANTIKYDQATQLITAYGGIDTTKGPLNLPTIKQPGGSESQSDTIKFNTKTQRALTKNTYYKEGDMFIYAQAVKKINKNTEFAYRSRFTTCNLDTPHYAFITRKMKIVNDKIAVTGPTMPSFEGVPIPIVIPFGIFPLERGRHSGFLPPQFTNNFSLGLGLEGLGYYKVLNDNWDVTVRSNIYTYGGWNLDIKPDYFKRYAYRGTLDLSIQKTKSLNTSGLLAEEFTTYNSFFITWTHSSDTRARPGTSFTASVRAGSTKYNKYLPDNAFRNYDNQLASSITYGKTWDQGKYILSVAANHNQNNSLGLINIQAPTVTFTASTIYPFQRKEQVGPQKWYQKLGISYSGTALNQLSFYDSIFNFHKLLDTAMWGFDHRIPVTLTLPALGPILASPSVSYEERWFGQEVLKTWDNKKDTLLSNIKRGFFMERQVSFAFAVNTRLFGTFKFKHGSVAAIRHEVKPFISLNYQPDLTGPYNDSVQVDITGRKEGYSKLNGGVISAFSPGKFGGISFGIDNLLEMKVRSKTVDTTSGDSTKKIRLIDGFGISGGYNLIAPGDSLNWSPLTFNLRSTLFGNVNITGSATVDPYGVDSFGNRVNKFLWAKGSLGRFTGGNFALSTSLKSKSSDGKTDQDRVQPDQTLTPDEQQRQLDYVRQNPSEFVDFNIPWTLQLSLAINFARLQAPNLTHYYTQISSNVNVNGDFSLSPKWKVGGGTYFDFRTLKIQTVNLFLTREMHCWQMAINLQLGTYKSFSVVINPKSGILRDLKINRTRSFATY
jgi:lipopolysaccharide assembly outer membrane protein LptD (OstA)